MFDWFKPKNKKNIVLPSEKVGPMQGVELVQAFSTSDEPKLAEYPREQYSVYWETLLDAVPGGYAAKIRFYSYTSGLLNEAIIGKQSVLELREAVSQVIRETMSQYKRSV